VKRFRHDNAELFESALAHTVKLAVEFDLVDVGDLAIDSVKLRAHASTKAVRTLERSRERLKELSAARDAAANADEQAALAPKLQRHRDAIAQCEATGRTNIVLTNESAGLMKFPHGASWPGHRVTVTAAGMRSRLVLSVLIDADGNDYGKLVRSVERARETLRRAGHAQREGYVAAADAGYFSSADLASARENADWLDVIVASSESGGSARGGRFGRERFEVRLDAPPICPAGKEMSGPSLRADGDEVWSGVGCSNCPIRVECTGKDGRRRLHVNRPIEEMRQRLRNPDIKTRYNRRIATVEPVFAHLVDTMGYRRVTSRDATTVKAEILLKVLAHNVARLITAERLRLVYVALDLN
jgi:hypothetical protein